ncbi:MAG: ankyrin repeat domain-containing protein [Planctomycetota bacterium]
MSLDLERAAAALQRGDDADFRRLVQGGVRDRRTGDGSTALRIAVDCRRPDLVALCLRHGASADVAADDGHTPLTSALDDGDSELVIVRALLDAGAAPAGLTPDDRHLVPPVPLAVAAARGASAAIAALLDAGAAVDQREHEDGETALMIAARQGHLEAAHLLLARGADPTLRDRTVDQTALDIAEGSPVPDAAAVARLLRAATRG